MGVWKIAGGICIGLVLFVFVMIMLIGAGMSGHDYSVQVISDGNYVGNIYANESSVSYDGSGDNVYKLGDVGVVSASFMNEDGSTLTVNILDGDKVVKTGSTSSEYGSVTVSV